MSFSDWRRDSNEGRGVKGSTLQVGQLVQRFCGWLNGKQGSKHPLDLILSSTTNRLQSNKGRGLVSPEG